MCNGNSTSNPALFQTPNSNSLLLLTFFVLHEIFSCFSRFHYAGYARGTSEFDKAFFAQDAAMIDNIIIDKTSFLNFFDAPDDQFSFLHMWRVADRLWEAWDCATPILIHGFVTPSVSEKLLALRSTKPGSFLMRFSSKGGLAVDYVRNGKMEKAHWKYSTLVDANALRSLLYDSVQWGPNLQFLVDTTFDNGFNSNVVSKDMCFPAVQAYEDDVHMEADPIVRTGYSSMIP